jgi:hypothetical protein
MEQESRGRAGGGPNDGSGAAGEAGERAIAELERLRDRMAELNEKLVALIRRRPTTALLVAAVAGYLIGRLLR